MTGREHSWQPVDLGPIVAGVQAGEIVGPVPELMARTNGPCLLYPGEVHSLAGEPESGKGWITLATAASVIATGATVLYLDFEDAPSSIVGRLLALDAAPDAILEHFAYVRPTDAFGADAFYALLELRTYALAVIDGVSEAYALLGLDPDKNPDAAKFLAAVARPLADRGAAVLEVDHVAKSRETRGRYAIGAQHKLAGIATAYSTDVIKAPSRTDAGLIKLKVEKDRHGHVRGHAQGDVIALAHITPADGGARVTITLEAPDASSTVDGEFRPTHLMEQISRHIENESGASLNSIRRGVTGRSAYIDLALRHLIAEGFVERRREGQAQRHYTVTTYRKSTDHDPATQPRPNRDPDTAAGTATPRPHPLRGGTVGHGHADSPNGQNRDPDPDEELARISSKFGDHDNEAPE